MTGAHPTLLSIVTFDPCYIIVRSISFLASFFVVPTSHHLIVPVCKHDARWHFARVIAGSMPYFTSWGSKEGLNPKVRHFARSIADSIHNLGEAEVPYQSESQKSM